jgi:hypothetical protein
LEDVVSRINTPALATLAITFYDPDLFDTPSLRDFISRTEIVKSLRKASISFFNDTSTGSITFYPEEIPNDWNLDLRIEHWESESEWGFSSLAKLYCSSLPRLPTLKFLEIELHDNRRYRTDYRYDYMESAEWLKLLRPFIFVRDLVLSEGVGELLAPTLQELARGNVTGVLPMLQNIFLKEPYQLMDTQEAFGQFIAARQHAGHPVNYPHWLGGGDPRCEVNQGASLAHTLL